MPRTAEDVNDGAGFSPSIEMLRAPPADFDPAEEWTGVAPVGLQLDLHI